MRTCPAIADASSRFWLFPLCFKKLGPSDLKFASNLVWNSDA
jgi:hypothetical protein